MSSILSYISDVKYWTANANIRPRRVESSVRDKLDKTLMSPNSSRRRRWVLAINILILNLVQCTVLQIDKWDLRDLYHLLELRHASLAVINLIAFLAIISIQVIPFVLLPGTASSIVLQYMLEPIFTEPKEAAATRGKSLLESWVTTFVPD